MNRDEREELLRIREAAGAAQKTLDQEGDTNLFVDEAQDELGDALSWIDGMLEERGD